MIEYRVDCAACDHDLGLHQHFTSRPFSWCRPQFNAYTPADKRPRVLLNRYPHNVIGAAVVVFGRCYVMNWKR